MPPEPDSPAGTPKAFLGRTRSPNARSGQADAEPPPASRPPQRATSTSSAANGVGADRGLGAPVLPTGCGRRMPCSRRARAHRRCRPMVSMSGKPQANVPMACAGTNSRQVGPNCRGAGSDPPACGISQTVEAAIGCPSRAGAARVRRCLQRLLSRAKRSTGIADLRPVVAGGNPAAWSDHAFSSSHGLKAVGTRGAPAPVERLRRYGGGPAERPAARRTAWPGHRGRP